MVYKCEEGHKVSLGIAKSKLRDLFLYLQFGSKFNMIDYIMHKYNTTMQSDCSSQENSRTYLNLM